MADAPGADWWLNATREEIEARWVISYQSGAVKRILKQINRNDLYTKWRNEGKGTDTEAKFAWLVEEFQFPIWLVPRKVKRLDNLVRELMARPSRSAVYEAYREVCEEVPANTMGCPARGIIFNWPHHDMYSVFHDLQDQPLGGHGWYFHSKRDGKRYTLQPLKAVIRGLGDPDDWAN